jgi:glycerol dehydrogenase-like iron-containing ADH family enzyme
MELDIVDQLLICIADQPRNVPMAMRDLGYTQDQISEAWTAARAARYTESTGLGMDRLTDAGRTRARELAGGDQPM